MRAAVTVALALTLGGCASVLGLDDFEPEGGPDAGMDAGEDGGVDAGVPPSTDAGPDAGDRPDSGPDGGTAPVTLAVALGNTHSCLLDEGEVLCWGNDLFGQFGNGASNSSAPSPVAAFVMETDWDVLSAGGDNTCALRQGGRVHCSGPGSDGQLGPGGQDLLEPPAAFPILLGDIDRVMVDVGMYDGYAVAAGGVNIYRWGRNDDGITGGPPGDPGLVWNTLPMPAVQVAIGPEHGCALMTLGTLVCWGDSDEGQLGRAEDPMMSYMPNIDIASEVSGVTGVAAGDDFTCVIESRGVRCFGSRNFGTMGDGMASLGNPALTPVEPAFPSAVVGPFRHIAAANRTVCAVDDIGQLFCWGETTDGQAGIAGGAGVPCGSMGEGRSCVTIPNRVLPTENVVRVDVGLRHACAVTEDREVWCWGADDAGQLGDGPTDSTGPVPVLVGTFL